MREWAQTAAMRIGLLNVITVEHVIKSVVEEAIFLDLGGLPCVQKVWIRDWGVGGFLSFCLAVCVSVCLCPLGVQTDLPKIRSD